MDESDLKRLEDAIAALTLCRQGEDRLALARALVKAGYVERRLKLFVAALLHYSEAADIYRETGAQLLLAHTVRHIGDIHMDFEQVDLARPFYDEALVLYRQEEPPPPLDLANAIRSMAVLKDHTGDTAGGAPLWREARELYLSVNVPAGVAECERRLSKRV